MRDEKDIAARTRPPVGALLTGGILAALSFGCGSGNEPLEPFPDQKVFLLNLDRERISLGERNAVDLRKDGRPEAIIRRTVVGNEARRALLLQPSTTVRFHDVIRPGGSLHFGIGFRPDATEDVPYRCEALVRGPDGTDHVVWSSSVRSPSSTAEARWTDVEVSLDDYSVGDVVLRTTHEGPGEPPPLLDVPEWSNPILVSSPLDLAVVESPPRNVIVFLIDTLRADHLGAYGYDKETSPHFDAVAEESVVFLQAHAAASWTKASVASLFTSRFPSQHGSEGFQDRLKDSETTVAEVFAAAGYLTGAIGYSPWIFKQKFNLGQGFRDYIEVFGARAEAPARAGTVVDEVLDWITRHREDRFLLYVQVIDPHMPYFPLEAQRARFVDTGYDGPLDGSVKGDGTHLGRRAEDVTEADLAHLQSLYDAEIALSDEQLGRLVSLLRRLGLWDEMTFVITADHGEEFLEHGAWNHGHSLYQDQLNVPLVIKPPKSAGIRPQRIDTPVSLIDVAPTLCRFAREPYEDLPFRGQDLMKLVVAPGSWENRPILSELNRNENEGYAVRRGNLKYISWIQPTTWERVHRLDSDHDEQVNVVEELSVDLLEQFRGMVQAIRDSRQQPGLYIECFGGGESSVVEVEFWTRNTELDFTLREAEEPSEGDRFEQHKMPGKKLLRVRAHLTMNEKDRKDSILLRVTPDDELSVTILLNGEPLDRERILIGPEGIHPPEDTIRLICSDDRLVTDAPPPGEDRDGVWCRIWRLEKTEVSLEGPGLDALRDLGYVDD